MLLTQSFEEWTAFMVRHSLSPNQMFFLHALLTKNHHLLNQYLFPVGGKPRKLPPGEIEELFDRGFLLDLNPVSDPETRSFYIDLYHVTELFTDLLVNKMTIEQAKELWEAYPDFIPGKTHPLPAKTISYPLFDRDELLDQYLTRIGHSVEKHQEILALVDRAKAQGDISMGIQKWITSNQWEILDRLYKASSGDDSYGSKLL